ncbi:phage shock protein C (PspC) family protein [Agromyces ramosus]|uniref:Phage shock protein C (PspC) family protein n=1 Tax=Agromyces ramosus TaxID=33879 RepID=A0A4Q7MP46_9MICO|nr:PspC domain-containing protein [Agromyces ramosus]RZS68572.1 phage shock protein C (PspC) family protein [Agromyces ramosus]
MTSTSTPPATGEPGGAPGDAPAGATAPPPSDDRFFAWLRSLGVPRRPGWIGGVAAGIAARIGIDPIIVRGVLVVVALFLPLAFLAYGAAWLLLPDATGRIHLESMLRGVFDSALVGIAAFVLVGLLGFGGPWWFGGWSWDPDEWFGPFRWIGVLWLMLVLAGVVTLIVWLARRASPTAAVPSDATATVPSASAGTAPTGASAATNSAAAASAATIPMPSAAPATEPVAPPPPASAHHGSDDYAAWKVQHDAWRAEHDAWRRGQDEANRAARAQLAAENRARALEFQAQAEEARRIRRLTRPRTSFAYVVATLGAALVAGAIASMAALGSAQPAPQAVTIGLAVSAIVTALAMVLAGSLRRRSGFLAFVTIVLLLSTLVTAVVPPAPRLVLGGVAESARTTSIVQPIGAVSLTVDDQVAGAAAPVEWTLAQGVGSVSIDLHDGARVALVVRCAECTVTHARFDADGDWSVVDEVDLGAGQTTARWSDEIGPGLEAGEVDAVIRIQAITTEVTVTEFEPEENRP